MNDEASIEDIYQLLLRQGNLEVNRPSRFRATRLEYKNSLIHRPPGWFMYDGQAGGDLSGFGSSPAEAALAFDLAWTTGKNEVFPVPKGGEPPEGVSR